MFVFHHRDIDGYASAAVVRQAFPEERINYVPCDYSFPLDSHLPEIQRDEKVVIVDYSFKDNTVVELENIICHVGFSNVTWIDHHVSSVRLVAERPDLGLLPGIRNDKCSGAVLTYMHYHGERREEACPLFLRLISDYDTWTKLMPESDDFNRGLFMEEMDPTSPLWDELYDMKRVELVIRNGNTVNRYLDMYYRHRRKKWMFVTEFEGYRTAAINQKESSEEFGEERVNFPLSVIFQTNGKKWFYTVYSSDPAIDCSEIAARYGGGGHKGAAGFTTEELLDCFKHVNV